MSLALGRHFPVDAVGVRARRSVREGQNRMMIIVIISALNAG
jgi:hypothetical protein